jgi:hypothetical protein
MTPTCPKRTGYTCPGSCPKKKGIPLEDVHDPADVGCLGDAKAEDWPKVLRLLQNWGWEHCSRFQRQQRRLP